MRYVAASRALSEADFRALAGFRYALRRFFHFSEGAAAAAGVSPRQYQALLAIRAWEGAEPATIGELAERLQLRHHSAVGLVQRLVGRSLVTRRPLARDRRRVGLVLTARGQRLLARLASAHRAELRQFRSHLAAVLDTL